VATPYEKVYDRFGRKMTDFNLVEIDDYTLSDMFHGWLESAVIRIRKCQHDLSKRNDESQEFLEDLSDLEIELLAMGMLDAWLSQYLNSTENVLQFIGGKEEKLEQIFVLSSLRLETA
jgi:hypothetical protein